MERAIRGGTATLELRERNRAFYDAVWDGAKVRPPRWFSTWDVAQELVACGPRTLEIGPGARPRLPLETAIFLDVSRSALQKLVARGARTLLGDASALPLATASLDAVAALDVIEHAADPDRVAAEISRVLRPGGRLLLSVPVHRERWTRFDDVVGHGVRFDASSLALLLERHALAVERSAAFGILPHGGIFPRIAAWFLVAAPRFAAWFEDRVVLPVARRREQPLAWQAGLQVDEHAEGVILLGRKRG
jgi:SAM-dependent methyltransferase